MGKTITPTYRVEYQDNSCRVSWHLMCWRGRASERRLEQWRRDYNRSFNPGGVNFHVSQGLGVVLHINKARIVHQASGAIVAQVTMPTFEIA